MWTHKTRGSSLKSNLTWPDLHEAFGSRTSKDVTQQHLSSCHLKQFLSLKTNFIVSGVFLGQIVAFAFFQQQVLWSGRPNMQELLSLCFNGWRNIKPLNSSHPEPESDRTSRKTNNGDPSSLFEKDSLVMTCVTRLMSDSTSAVSKQKKNFLLSAGAGETRKCASVVWWWTFLSV